MNPREDLGGNIRGILRESIGFLHEHLLKFLQEFLISKGLFYTFLMQVIQKMSLEFCCDSFGLSENSFRTFYEKKNL